MLFVISCPCAFYAKASDNTMRRHDVTDEEGHKRTQCKRNIEGTNLQSMTARPPRNNEKPGNIARNARGKALITCGVMNEKTHKQAHTNCTRYVGGSEPIRTHRRKHWFVTYSRTHKRAHSGTYGKHSGTHTRKT